MQWNQKEVKRATNSAQCCCGQGSRRRRTTTASTTIGSTHNYFNRNSTIKHILKCPVQWYRKEVKRATNSAHYCCGQSSHHATSNFNDHETAPWLFWSGQEGHQPIVVALWPIFVDVSVEKVFLHSTWGNLVLAIMQTNKQLKD